MTVELQIGDVRRGGPVAEAQGAVPWTFLCDIDGAIARRDPDELAQALEDLRRYTLALEEAAACLESDAWSRLTKAEDRVEELEAILDDARAERSEAMRLLKKSVRALRKARS